MAVHLDTSFVISALVSGSRADALLREWIARGEDLLMSAVAWTEFLCGPLDVDELRVMAHIIGEPVPFTSGEGVRAAEIFNDTGCRRGSLTDCMIAASALNAGAALATANPGDFRRIPGLTVLAAGAAVSG